MRHLLLLTFVAGTCAFSSVRLTALELISVDSAGVQSPLESRDPTISDDGRYVAFRSSASLVPEDANGELDVYLRDRLLGTTSLVSVNPDGVAANAHSRSPRISGDGSAVAFLSKATDLVPGGGNGNTHVYVRNLRNRTTTKVSVDAEGIESDGFELSASISGDGTKIAFESSATNLVDDDMNGRKDIFVVTVGAPATIERISVGPSGEQSDNGSDNPSISHDGNFVAFESTATNLVPSGTGSVGLVFRRDLVEGATRLVSRGLSSEDPTESCEAPSISGDGRFTVFESEADNIVFGDANGEYDIFLYDANADAILLLTKTSTGDPTTGSSGIDVDRAISKDGRYVVFYSYSDNLTDHTVSGSQGYRLDRNTGEIELITRNLAGEGSESSVFNSQISGNGAYVVFYSTGDDLVENDGNLQLDVFAWPNAFPKPPPVAIPDNSAIKSALSKKIRKLKKKMKSAKRKKQVAKVKRFKKKIKKLTRQLRAL